MSTPQKPTIIIVPGSFSPAHLYDTLISQLTAHGYPAHTVPLPSVQLPSATTPPATLAQDAAAIATAITEAADAGQEVLLAMHSYSGIPGTESAKGLSKAARAAEGKKGGLVGLVYITAFMVQEGQSLRDITGQTPEMVPQEHGYMMIDSNVAAAYAPIVYSDLPLEEGVRWIGEMQGHSSVSYDGKLSYAAYRDVPTTYMVCETDQVILPEVQRGFVEKAGVEIRVLTTEASHGINVSRPEEMVRAIRTAAGEKI